jgi:hypothetical protein
MKGFLFKGWKACMSSGKGSFNSQTNVQWEEVISNTKEKKPCGAVNTNKVLGMLTKQNI